MKDKKRALPEITEQSVGYCSPPKHSQFQKGKSGNPGGRPKLRKSLQTLVMEALNELVVVTENGTSKRISKRQAAAKQLANKVAKGETASLKLLVQLLAGVEDRPESYAPDGAHSAREKLRAMVEKIAAQERQDKQ